jgi:hypothetical protein
VGFVLILMEN